MSNAIEFVLAPFKAKKEAAEAKPIKKKPAKKKAAKKKAAKKKVVAKKKRKTKAKKKQFMGTVQIIDREDLDEIALPVFDRR